MMQDPNWNVTASQTQLAMFKSGIASALTFCVRLLQLTSRFHRRSLTGDLMHRESMTLNRDFSTHAIEATTLELGLGLSRDPIGFNDEMNPYGYGHDSRYLGGTPSVSVKQKERLSNEASPSRHSCL